MKEYNMLRIEYKGFTITETGTSGRFVISPDATSFNLNGYATLNNAKGAITKAIRASDQVEQHPVKAATSDDKDRATVAVSSNVTPSRNKREGKYAGRSQKIYITRNGKTVDVMHRVHVRCTEICLADRNK